MWYLNSLTAKTKVWTLEKWLWKARVYQTLSSTFNFFPSHSSVYISLCKDKAAFYHVPDVFPVFALYSVKHVLKVASYINVFAKSRAKHLSLFAQSATGVTSYVELFYRCWKLQHLFISFDHETRLNWVHLHKGCLGYASGGRLWTTSCLQSENELPSSLLT